MTNLQILLVLIVMVFIAIYNITKPKYYLIAYKYKIKRKTGEICEGLNSVLLTGTLMGGYPNNLKIRNAIIKDFKAEEDDCNIAVLTISKMEKAEYKHYIGEPTRLKIKKEKPAKIKETKKPNNQPEAAVTNTPIAAGASTKPIQQSNKKNKHKNK